MSNPNSKKLDIHLLSRIMRQARPYRYSLWISALIAVLLAPLATLRPYLIQQMVDEHIFFYDISGLTRLALVFLLVLFLHAALQYAFIYLTNWLGQVVVQDLRSEIFSHIISLRLSYFDRTPIGNSTTRTINDMETINTVFSQGIITILADILTLLVVLAIMFVTSWKLTLICLATLPFIILASYIFKERVKEAFQKVRTQVGRMNAFLQEHISGMRIVQIFHAEAQEAEKFRIINREYTTANLDSVFHYAVFYPVVEIISAASLGLMVWWGSRGVLHHEVTLGALVAFPIYLNMLFNPIRTIADKFNTLQMGLVAADRVYALLDMPEHVENSGQYAPDRLRGEIAFEHVTFSYNGTDPVLKDVSFRVEAGQTLAIVGRSEERR
ncbi:MAG: ABC transporter transmembrane domain-containing protein, partial [Haliscomenobacter sp.]